MRQLDARPRLTLVSRDGDPAPAIVAAFATDLGSAPTTALAALVEARLRAADFDVDTRVDRSAFRVRWAGADAARAAPFLAALASALSHPVAAGSKELALVAERLQALRRNPLDAPELAAVAACTGRLGASPSDPIPDPTTTAGVRELEGYRRAALVAERTSIAAVGPAPFCVGAADALQKTNGWEAGTAAADAWPAGDSLGVYVAPGPVHGARLSIALRVADPHAAVLAAERLAATGSALQARLAALSQPWRAIEVVGSARPHGGCLGLTLEAGDEPTTLAVDRAAALAAAVARDEMRAELAAPSDPSVATRQILTATDPREAASRAAWWTLAGSLGATTERSAIALGVPPASARAPRGGIPSSEAVAAGVRQRFAEELERASAAISAQVAERRTAVESGQGELWVLLASPCGVADEGAQDPGVSAVATVAAVAEREAARALGIAPGAVLVEPWITPDGVGVVAHAPPEPGESAADLSRRVGDAAGRTLAGTVVSAEALRTARATTLEHLERTAGRSGAAMAAFAGAIAPDRPAWVEPFGTWDRVGGAGLESVRLRLASIAGGPLRVAVLANADAAQGAAAAAAVDRWLRPRVGPPRPCPAAAAASARAGQYDARLPRDATSAQVLLGAAVPPVGAPGRDLAELTAAALDGPDGLLASALRGLPTTVRPAARLAGGARASALVIDVRAPSDALDGVVAEVKALLARLAQGTVTEADLARAEAVRSRRDRDARSEPIRRLVDLWSGRSAAPPPRASIAAWREHLATTLREPALVVVEARPD